MVYCPPFRSKGVSMESASYRVCRLTMVRSSPSSALTAGFPHVRLADEGNGTASSFLRFDVLRKITHDHIHKVAKSQTSAEEITKRSPSPSV